MWGEIEEPVKAQPILIEEVKDEDKFDLPVKAETSYQRFVIYEPKDPQQQLPEPPVSWTETLT